MEFLISFIIVLRLSPGRRIQMYRQMRPLAQAVGNTQLVAQIDKATNHDTDTRLKIDQYKHGGRNTYAGPVQTIDRPADRMLSGLYAMITGVAAGLPPQDPIRAMSEELLAATFPNGPGAITRLPYVEQVVAMENLVSMLRGEHAERVAELGLTLKVSRLADITVEYRRMVDLGSEPSTAPDVRAANQRGHTLMLEIVAIILGTYFDSDNPEHTATRQALLAPLADQVELMRQARRARRNRGMDSDFDSAAPAAADTDGDTSDAGGDINAGADGDDIDAEPAPGLIR